LPFDREVDYHHQIAYVFEKSFRLRENNKPEAVVKAANVEITQLIAGQTWILQLDPLILFYCLYFSVFYQNEELLSFLKDLIEKLGFINKKQPMNIRKKQSMKSLISKKTLKNGNNEFDKFEQVQKTLGLMQDIEANGIQTLSNPANTESLPFFHVVFYQAV
jgi:hypothetical protein